MKVFDDWFNEQELYSLRSDRLHSLLDNKQWMVVCKWLEAAYNQGREDQREEHREKNNA